MFKPCVYCGNNPTPHLFTKFNDYIMTVVNPLNRWLFGSALGEAALRLTDLVIRFLLWLFSSLGILQYGHDPNKAASGRGKVLWYEALGRGILMESVRVLGREIDYYRVTVHKKTFYFTGLPRPEFQANDAVWWMDDKAIVKQKFLAANIPVPLGGSCTNYSEAITWFNKLTKPVIVKPRFGSRGRHTTTFIYTVVELKQAFKIARQLCQWVIVEEHLRGSVYRGTVINGELVGVLAGEPPRVTGDGQHTVAELIEQKNQHRRPPIVAVVITPLLKEFLARNHYTINDVLPVGTTIDLSEKIGVSYGGNSIELTNVINPQIKKIVELAARVVGDPILGFDFIAEDIMVPPQEQKWGIIECNGLPFINLHHEPVVGEPQNVAARVWNFVEENINLFL